MTLGEFIKLVADKAHRNDAESLEEFRNYVRFRYKMLWDSRPWRDTVGFLQVPATAVRKGSLILPRIVDRVMQVRFENTLLRTEELQTLLIYDPTAFERKGEPLTFSLAASSATADYPRGRRLVLVPDAGSANMAVSIRGLLRSDERTESVTANGNAPAMSAHNYDDVLSLSKSSRTHGLTVRTDTGIEILRLRAPETSVRFARVQFHSLPFEEAEDDDSLKVNVLYIEDVSWRRMQSGSFVFNLQRTFELPDPEAATEALTVINVLFKRRFKQLENDEDAIEIHGLDNALLAAALSDMHESQRQFDKAAAKMTEAGTHATALADLERHQSASNSRLMPEEPDDGYSFLGGGVPWL